MRAHASLKRVHMNNRRVKCKLTQQEVGVRQADEQALVQVVDAIEVLKEGIVSGRVDDNEFEERQVKLRGVNVPVVVCESVPARRALGRVINMIGDEQWQIEKD